MLQKGFTLIELMIVVAIIGILSMFALPAYQDYTKRTYVSEGIALSTAAKMAATEYYSTEGEWPTSNTQAGLPSGNSIKGQAVAAIWINEGGSASAAGASVVSDGMTNINIYYNSKVVTGAAASATVPGTGTVGDNVVVIAPVSATNAGSVQWNCTKAGTKIEKKWLPANCRNAF